MWPVKTATNFITNSTCGGTWFCESLFFATELAGVHWASPLATLNALQAWIFRIDIENHWKLPWNSLPWTALSSCAAKEFFLREKTARSKRGLWGSQFHQHLLGSGCHRCQQSRAGDAFSASLIGIPRGALGNGSPWSMKSTVTWALRYLGEFVDACYIMLWCPWQGGTWAPGMATPVEFVDENSVPIHVYNDPQFLFSCLHQPHPLKESEKLMSHHVNTDFDQARWTTDDIWWYLMISFP